MLKNFIFHELIFRTFSMMKNEFLRNERETYDAVLEETVKSGVK